MLYMCVCVFVSSFLHVMAHLVIPGLFLFFKPCSVYISVHSYVSQYFNHKVMWNKTVIWRMCKTLNNICIILSKVVWDTPVSLYCLMEWLLNTILYFSCLAKFLVPIQWIILDSIITIIYHNMRRWSACRRKDPGKME